MAGLMEMLFGPDGVGGQPGLAGKAGNAIWQGTGELSPNAGFGETIAKSLGNIPHMLTDIAIKNPLEILKDPSSALNDNGEVSITRLLFPDFRRNAVKQRKDQEKLQGAYTSAQIFNTYDKLVNSFMQAPTDQRGVLAQQADAAGVPSEQTEAALAAAAAQDQRKQAALAKATAAGVAPDLAALALGDENEQAIADLVSRYETQKAADERARNRDAATQRRADARANAPGAVEKAVDEYNKALASGDPVFVAAAKANLLKLSKSSQPMVVTKPDGGVIVGPASEVSGFESTSARDKALAQIDAVDNLKATTKQLRDIAIRSPEAFGAAGSAGAFIQNLGAQAEAVAAMQDKARSDIASGGFENPETARSVIADFNPDIPTARALETTLAFAVARANNPDGKISDSDYNAAREFVKGATGGGEWLANSKATLAVLDLIDQDATRQRNRAVLRSRKGGGKQSELEAALSGKTPEQPKRRFGKKGKQQSSNEGSMTDEELRALRPDSDENIAAINNRLSDEEFARWEKIHQDVLRPRN